MCVWGGMGGGGVGHTLPARHALAYSIQKLLSFQMVIAPKNISQSKPEIGDSKNELVCIES